jgi:hypothetical protein
MAARADDLSGEDAKSRNLRDLSPTVAVPDVPETDAAKIARLESANAVLLQLAVTAGILKDHTAHGPMPEWSNVKSAAYRYGCSYERMRQLAQSGAVVSRRDGDGGSISILTASIDERLRLLGRQPATIPK